MQKNAVNDHLKGGLLNHRPNTEHNEIFLMIETLTKLILFQLSYVPTCIATSYNNVSEFVSSVKPQ